MPGFEMFRAPPKGPAVTITANGLLIFSWDAYELLGKPEAVQLLYDKDQRIIGIRPAGREAENTHRVRLSGRYTRVVSARAFCRHVGIEGESRRWPLTMKDGIGHVDIGQPGVPVIRRRMG
jgi:hypothetical protein